jgi:RNA polymerase sigma-70 factor (ECF subfamily)
VTAHDAEDRRAVERARAGESAAFAELYERHYRRVFGIAFGMSASVPAAEDLTQETFMRAYRKLGQYRGDSAFATWLHRLAVNVCLNFRARMEPAIVSASEATVPAHDDSLHQRHLQREVHAAILRLKPKQRIVVVLKDLQGLSYQEIAERLGCSQGTVASRLSEARRQLARRLAHLKGEIA